MKTPALLLLPVVLLGAAGAPDPVAVAAMARKAAPEFAADALIRLAADQKLDSRARIKLLSEAFRLAATAQHPLKLRASITRGGGAGGFLERAYQLDLDALSLRLRAVQQMLPLDRAKATKLFLSMAAPAVPPVRCEDIVVYDVAQYYDALGTIAKAGHLNAAKVLKGRAGGVSSPAQIAPVARLLKEAELKDSDLENFTQLLAGSLREMSGDDRSFTYYAAQTGPAILDLMEELKRRHLAPLPLTEAYRLYLVHHLSGDRCADDELINRDPSITINLMTGRVTDVLGLNAAAFFAEKMLLPPLKALSEQETTPHSLDGYAAGVQSCQDPACQGITRREHELAFDAEGQPLAESDHNTVAWRANLESTLKAMEEWQPGDGNVDEVFREKTWVYNNLYAMSLGASRDSVTRSWLNYLAQNRTKVSDRTQWLLPVSALIGRSPLDPSNTRLAEQLRTTDDPVIGLYVQVEHLAPRRLEQILALL